MLSLLVQVMSVRAIQQVRSALPHTAVWHAGLLSPCSNAAGTKQRHSACLVCATLSDRHTHSYDDQVKVLSTVGVLCRIALPSAAVQPRLPSSLSLASHYHTETAGVLHCLQVLQLEPETYLLLPQNIGCVVVTAAAQSQLLYAEATAITCRCHDCRDPAWVRLEGLAARYTQSCKTQTVIWYTSGVSPAGFSFSICLLQSQLSSNRFQLAGHLC